VRHLRWHSIPLAVAALALSFTVLAAATPPLSAEAQALVERVHAAYERADGLIASFPPPGDVTEELIRLRGIDQAGRNVYQDMDLSALPDDQRDAAYQAIWEEIDARDLENQMRLKELMPENGWFTISAYGEEGALSAFVIVQHAINDPGLQDRALAAMEPLLGSDEIDGRAYATLYDRVAMRDGEYQRYGSQMICMDNEWVLYPLEDPDGADERRRQAGFDLTLEENIARLQARPPCPGDYDGPLPG
jgi:hypothetical protein